MSDTHKQLGQLFIWVSVALTILLLSSSLHNQSIGTVTVLLETVLRSLTHSAAQPCTHARTHTQRLRFGVIFDCNILQIGHNDLRGLLSLVFIFDIFVRV